MAFVDKNGLWLYHEKVGVDKHGDDGPVKPARIKEKAGQTPAHRPLRLVFSIFCLTGILVLSLAQNAQAAKHPSRGAGRADSRYAAIVLDADTGSVLYQYNADKVLHPASLAKIMTLVMAFDALERKELRLHDDITISRHAANMSPSKLGLDPGASLRVEEAIYAIVTKSANDVAVALAERLGGSEKNFAARMTARAHEIGMSRTRFVNASGLPNAQQVTSARDMARLARYVLMRYPQHYHYFSARSFTYQGLTHRNHNRLMESYRGMDGFKTGFIDASGFNLVASAKRDGHRLIGVVFGGRTASSRNAVMASLLDNGFSQISRQVTVASAAPKAALPPPARKPAPAIVTAARPPAPAAASDKTAETVAQIEPAAGAADSNTKWALLTPFLQGRTFGELLGNSTVATVRSAPREDAEAARSEPQVYEASFAPSLTPGRSWAVQVGAFGSRARTDLAIGQARKALPERLARGPAAIAPLKTRGGWVFRGRLGGYTRAEAAEACRYIRDCLPVSPQIR